MSTPFTPVKRHPIKRIAILTLGWVLLIVGGIGGLIPIFQGWPFGIAGLLILSREYEWAHNLVQRIRKRFPKFASIMDKTSDHSSRILKRIFRRSAAEKAGG